MSQIFRSYDKEIKEVLWFEYIVDALHKMRPEGQWSVAVSTLKQDHLGLNPGSADC